MDICDGPTHLVGDRPIRRMAFSAGAQLDQVERCARIELEDVANAEREAERVRRLLDEAPAAKPRVLGAGDLERTLVLAAEPGRDDLVRNVCTEVWRQALPLA